MLAAMHPASSFGQQLVDDPRRWEAARGGHRAGYLARGAAAARSTGYRPADAASVSLAKLAAIPSDLLDRIASAFLLILLFGKQIYYQLSV